MKTIRALIFGLLLTAVNVFGATTFTQLAVVTNSGNNQVTITFTTSGSISSWISYGTGSGSGVTSPDSGGTSHTATLSRLVANTTYNYQAIAADGSKSAVQQFQICDGSGATSNLSPLQGKVNSYYLYGTWAATWTDQSGTGNSPTLCGVPVTTPVNGSLDYLGSMSYTFPDTMKIAPSPSAWSITASDVGNIGPATVVTQVTGASTDISNGFYYASLNQLQYVWYNPTTHTFFPPITGGGVSAVTGTAPITSTGGATPAIGITTTTFALLGRANVFGAFQNSFLASTWIWPACVGGVSSASNNSCLDAGTGAHVWNPNTSSDILIGTGGGIPYPSGSGIPIVVSGTSWGTTVAAPAGTVVGTTDTQTLTNKTLDGVSPATMAFVDPTSSIQTQLNAKQATLTGTGLARNTGASTELSGDATTSGSNAVTVSRLNGTSLAGLATGILKNTTTTGVPSIATSADVIALWTGTCNSSSFLRGDGACAAPSGSGTVTSFSAGNLSPLFTTSVATATSTPALSFTLSNFSADNILGNFTGSPATPSTQAIPACANDGAHALVYPSHVLTCASITGSAPAFSTITSGTNTTAAMVLGSGSSLTVSGTGTNKATGSTETITSGNLYSAGAGNVFADSGIAATNIGVQPTGTGLVFSTPGSPNTYNTVTGTSSVTGVTGTGASLVLGAAPTLTGHPTIEGVTSTGATGTGNFVFSASPTLTGTTIAAAATLSGAFKVNFNTASLRTIQTGTVIQFGNADTVASRMECNSFAASCFYTGIRYDGTNASPTTLQSGDQIGGYNSFGYNGTSVVGPQASLRTFANQNWSVGANGTRVDITTTPNGSSTAAPIIQFENDGGITVPSTVTGGDKGAGTINAAGLYVNGVAVSTGGGTGGGGVISYSREGILLTGTSYLPPGGGANPSASEASVQMASSASTTISNLTIQVGTTPTSGNVAFTVQSCTPTSGACTGTARALTCTITNPAVSCTDSTHSFTVAAGDLIDVKAVVSATASTTDYAMQMAWGTSGVGVTSVTSANGDISVATTTTTPVLTFNSTTAIKNGTYIATDTGSANAMAGTTVDTFPGAYAAGQTVCIVPANANTGATTIAVNGLSAVNVTKGGAEALIIGDLLTAHSYCMQYDGTEFVLTNLPAEQQLTVPGGNATVTAGTPRWLTLNGTGNTTSQVINQVPMTGNGTLRFLSMTTTTTQATQTSTITVETCTPSSGTCTGTACGITITIANTAAAGIYSDTTHSCAVSKGDLVDVKITQNVTGASANFAAGSIDLIRQK